MSHDNSKHRTIETVLAKDLRDNETSLVYVDDKLELTSKDQVFVEGFIDGITKTSSDTKVSRYTIELSEDNPVKDSLSWLYVKSGGIQIFSEMKERILKMSMVELVVVENNAIINC